jgi:hypothetical protein
MVWTGSIWLRIGTSGGLCEYGDEPAETPACQGLCLGAGESRDGIDASELLSAV